MAERRQCAIYTRKSTEGGFEQSFNSLDAQRDPVLLQLVALATAAKPLMVDSGAAPTVAHDSKRHLWQLLRVGENRPAYSLL